MASSHHFPAAKILLIQNVLEAGCVQHSKKQFLGIRSNMSGIQPENLRNDGKVLRVRSNQKKLAAGFQRPTTQLKKSHCIVIIHVLDNMTAENSAELLRIASEIVASLLTVNGQALFSAGSD